MKITFTAQHAMSEDDGDVIYCVLSGVGEQDAEEHYFALQRTVGDATDNWGIHLEYDDQSNGDYGCLAACRISRTQLQVDLLHQLGELAGVTGFEVALAMSDAEYEEFLGGLRKLCRTPGTLSIT